MKFRRSICTAVLLAVLLTLLVPTSVFALEDNSSTLPPYKNDLLYERLLMRTLLSMAYL